MDERMEIAAGQRGGAHGAPRAVSRDGSWQCDRVAAAGLAVLFNALLAALLLPAPGLAPPEAGVTESPIEVVWIARPAPAQAPAVPMVREREPEPVQLPAPDSGLQVMAVPRGVQLPADETPPSLPPEDANGRALAGPEAVRGPDVLERGEFRRRGVFGTRPEDPFTRTSDGPYRMQDRSLGGRLQRMAKRADCAELRARLRGGGTEAEAAARTMVHLRCT